MLVWNNETYDYEPVFRIWRYISFALAIMFNLVYTGVLTKFFVDINGKVQFLYDVEKGVTIADADGLGTDVAWGVYDMFTAMFAAYMSIVFLPTFLTNLVIIMKESFMKQDAWDAEDDYQSGMFLDIDLDFLKDVGIPADDEYYTNYIKEVAHEYL